MSDAAEKIIGLYGGSFDPVHKGHIRVARAFIRRFSPEKLLIMPCRIPPHKTKSECACADMRLRMLKAAFENDEKAEVSDFELKKPGVSYTVETLRELKRIYPGHRIMLIVGTDMYLSLRDWKNADEIFSLCEPCVYARGSKKRETAVYAQGILRDFGVQTHFIKGRLTNVSSTGLREKLASDKCVDSLIPRGVKRIIDETGVYRSEQYRLAVYRELSERSVEKKRFDHILRVEQAAIRLAEHYGVDVFKARAAALLHDVTKRKTLDEQLNLASEFDIIEGSGFTQAPKVAHAFTAAAFAEHRLSVTDADIVNAVRFHTTGRAGMSTLEKLIFLADGIEDGRDFKGVEELREAAFESLDKAMLISLEATKTKIEKSGAYLHPYTAEAIEYFEGIVK